MINELVKWEDEDVFAFEELSGGLVSQFKYQMRINSNLFEIYENGKDVPVYTTTKLKNCVLLYSHQVATLYQGFIMGKTDKDTMSDEDLQVVAKSYGNIETNARDLRFFSAGNFLTNGFKDYLVNPELKKLVKKRFYFYFKTNDPQAKKSGVDPDEVIIATVGITNASAYYTRAKLLASERQPVWAVLTDFELEPSKNKDGQSYMKIKFTSKTLKPSAKTKEEIIKKYKEASETVRLAHVELMRSIEGQKEKMLLIKDEVGRYSGINKVLLLEDNSDITENNDEVPF